MPASALARQQLELDILPGLRTREEIISRYRHLREISKQINDGLLKLVPRSAILRQDRNALASVTSRRHAGQTAKCDSNSETSV